MTGRCAVRQGAGMDLPVGNVRFGAILWRRVGPNTGAGSADPYSCLPLDGCLLAHHRGCWGSPGGKSGAGFSPGCAGEEPKTALLGHITPSSPDIASLDPSGRHPGSSVSGVCLPAAGNRGINEEELIHHRSLGLSHVLLYLPGNHFNYTCRWEDQLRVLTG